MFHLDAINYGDCGRWRSGHRGLGLVHDGGFEADDPTAADRLEGRFLGGTTRLRCRWCRRRRRCWLRY